MTVFAEQSRLMLAALAAEVGCDVAAFSTHALTVVPRLPGHRAGVVAHGVDTGMGTVLSVDESLLSWARDSAPADRHFRALQPFFLAELAGRARDAGFTTARAYGLSLGFALDSVSAVPVIPAGLRLVEVDRAWMDRYRPTNEFDNALGEPDEGERFERTRTAFALMDAQDEPAAVAAVWDEHHGREEIGVDVRRSERGRGLAKIVVATAVNDILKAGRIPFYSCGATNIRSHRNALACGFLPLYVTGMVFAAPPIEA